MTTLAERLAAVRDERGHGPGVARRNDDVATRLASWNGARLVTVEGGRVALVERRIPLPGRRDRAAQGHRADLLFRHRVDRAVDRRGNGDHPGRGGPPR